MSARPRLPFRPSELLQIESDRVLLDRYIQAKDEEAFAAIVRRHGPMVLGVCKRTIGDEHLAEDAFQAAFLVLSNRPEAVRRSASLASWLFGVARRVSLAARRKQRRAESRRPQTSNEMAPSTKPDFDELLRVLDDELAKLPDDLRAPLIACYLDERTQDEAALTLGWSLSTLRRRLERGKELLRGRLSRRGASFGAGLFAAWLAPSNASASVPSALLSATLSRQGASPTVTALAKAGLANRVLPGTLAFAMLGLLLCGSVALAMVTFDPAEPTPANLISAEPSAAKSFVLRGRVVLPLGREVPPPRRVEIIDKDAALIRSQGPVHHEDVVVNPENRGVQNVIVWLRPDHDDPRAAFPAGSVAHAVPATRVVEIGCCQFQPRAIAARAGDTLRFVNRSGIPHTVRYESSEADDFSVLLPANTGVDAPIPLASRLAAASFSCAIHPWMRGVVRVFDHPYFAVTDASGAWEIPQAPEGRSRIVYWHETAGYRGDRLGEPIRIRDSATLPRTEFDVTLR